MAKMPPAPGDAEEPLIIPEIQSDPIAEESAPEPPRSPENRSQEPSLADMIKASRRIAENTAKEK